MVAAILTHVGRGAVLGLVALCSIAFAAQASASSVEQVEGRVFIISSSVQQFPGEPVDGPHVSLRLEVDGELVSIDIVPETVITDEDGRVIDTRELRPGQRVRATGSWESPTRLVAAQVERIG